MVASFDMDPYPQPQWRGQDALQHPIQQDRQRTPLCRLPSRNAPNDGVRTSDAST
jgi:hypothetical protein